MNKSIVAIAAAGLVSAIGFTSVASAEATVYGRIVAGAIYVDGDTETADGAWNFGAVGQQGNAAPRSRIGFKGSQDLGNGMEAGFKIERDLRSSATGERHNHVYISGGFGKLTLGQQGNPYMSARKWDQTNFYGGQHGFGSSYRHEGVGYSMSSGPFSLNILATADDNSAVITEAKTTTVHYYTVSTPTGATAVPEAELGGVPQFIRVGDSDNDADTAPSACTGVSAASGNENYGCAQAHTIPALDNDGATNPTVQPSSTTRTRTDTPAVLDDSDGVDGWVIHAGYDFGAVNLDVAHQTNETDAAAARNNTAVGVNGSVGPLDWYLAWQGSELQNATVDNDIDSWGGFLGFHASEKDIIYGYHVAHSQDVASATLGEDFTETIVGYSRQIGPGVKFIAEYQSLDNDLADNDSPNQLALAVKYDF